MQKFIDDDRALNVSILNSSCYGFENRENVPKVWKCTQLSTELLFSGLSSAVGVLSPLGNTGCQAPCRAPLLLRPSLAEHEGKAGLL